MWLACGAGRNVGGALVGTSEEAGGGGSVGVVGGGGGSSRCSMPRAWSGCGPHGAPGSPCEQLGRVQGPLPTPRKGARPQWCPVVGTEDPGAGLVGPGREMTVRAAAAPSSQGASSSSSEFSPGWPWAPLLAWPHLCPGALGPTSQWAGGHPPWTCPLEPGRAGGGGCAPFSFLLSSR